MRNLSLPYLKVAIPLVVCIMFSASLNRSFIWQNELSLCEDTVKKSPLSKDVRAVYAGLLVKQGNYSEALRQEKLGRAIPSYQYDERFDLVLSEIHERQGNLDAAIQVSEDAVLKSKGKSNISIQNLLSLLVKKRAAVNDQRDKTLLDKRITELRLRMTNLAASKGK